MIKPGMKGICRVEQPQRNDYGWFVRVNYQGQSRQHYVSDSAHGGKRKALALAKALRNAAELELGRPHTDRIIAVRKPRSPYGIAGVNRRLIEDVKEDRVYQRDCFEATWSPCSGRFRRKQFSVSRHGERDAFRLACEFRLQKEREIYGQEVQTAAVRRALARLKNGRLKL